jgi:hypothetical protein
MVAPLRLSTQMAERALITRKVVVARECPKRITP